MNEFIPQNIFYYFCVNAAPKNWNDIIIIIIIIIKTIKPGHFKQAVPLMFQC